MYVGMYIILAECGYQILVTKICNGGRICFILTSLIPNISPDQLTLKLLVIVIINYFFGPKRPF